MSGYKVLIALGWLALITVTAGAKLAFLTLLLGFVGLIIKADEMLSKDDFTLNNSVIKREGMYFWITKQDTEEKPKNG